jgi:FAD binding domain
VELNVSPTQAVKRHVAPTGSKRLTPRELTMEANRLDTDVLIVGAGPTGLALATTLARAGVTPVIVDKLATGQNTSRAAVIHAHTLEVMEQIGVSERLACEGLKLATFSIRDRDRVLVRLRFDALPTRFAYLLMLPQNLTEKILAEGLTEAGGAVRWARGSGRTGSVGCTRAYTPCRQGFTSTLELPLPSASPRGRSLPSRALPVGGRCRSCPQSGGGGRE